MDAQLVILTRLTLKIKKSYFDLQVIRPRVRS